MKTYQQTIESMTMPFTIMIVSEPDSLSESRWHTTVTLIQTYLDHVDHLFSPFRSDSLVTQYQRHSLAVTNFNAEFQEVFALTVIAEEMTSGAFTANFSGQYDPTGIVKGWAIERAFQTYLKPLLNTGAIAVALNGAGDIRVGALVDSGYEWPIGIEDPEDTGQMLREIKIANGAVATSGSSKRGDHIRRLDSANTLTQATIIATNLIDADMLATTAISMGQIPFQTFAETHKLNAILLTAAHKLIMIDGDQS
ncbi:MULTISPECIES: FAD:protein FMN transferase [Lactobacillaceae]|jgi:thiamine biosynthesis lipoprotein|uniref:FAD:protein FMN transferase n=7 Tax=Bacillota TaxID=1239 RepID=A0A843R394_LIMFE|nr:MULTISPECIES: FAD:protein FMN transferase [Lactobacillaceae]EKQ06362.1 ApbE family thiamin biosynthesis lipoprotein [Lacticaseibacillus casei A2-362]MQM73769.1 FAD:protein FMN transferase [Candidatus Pseudoramibacter fermentans]OLS08290.1 thiamin biosynthesis protein ApbE [Lacticaseibacillus casei]RRF91719.1 MAG: FAD:protein FMN transferase [Coriobacteriaceae bacterium]APB87168.1 thiamin biosynthesis protein ApbE [Lactiplantibacillus plantarum]